MSSSHPNGTPPAADEPVVLPDVIVRCGRCGYEGPAEPRAPGKIWLEAVFWVIFVVPGLLYHLWRLLGRRYVCPRCKAEGQDVSVPTARRVAVAVRAVLTVLLLAAIAVLVFVWNVPPRPEGGG